MSDLYERTVRIESKVSKICLALGLDENGYPKRTAPEGGVARKPTNRAREFEPIIVDER